MHWHPETLHVVACALPVPDLPDGARRANSLAPALASGGAIKHLPLTPRQPRPTAARASPHARYGHQAGCNRVAAALGLPLRQVVLSKKTPHTQKSPNEAGGGYSAEGFAMCSASKARSGHHGTPAR